MKKLILLASAAMLAACTQAGELPGKDITIYTAEHILTVNDDMPDAEAIAINAEGGIVAVGAFKPLKSQLKGAAIDERFADKTIVPGLIDPHVHMVLGAMMYGLDFVPPWDMETPKGTVKGLPDKASLMAKIAEFEKAAPARDQLGLLKEQLFGSKGDSNVTSLDAKRSA